MPRVIVIGGGAAGYFAAIRCAELAPKTEILILERAAKPLEKVRISGGGRCNVTHACFDARELVKSYPRGARELLGPFHVFQPRDTVAWFQNRGVKLKTEPDGRMFPLNDKSSTIVDALEAAAYKAGVVVRRGARATTVEARPEGGFEVALYDGSRLACERLLIASGGMRSAQAGELAAALGHTLEAPVPSLFTFEVDLAWLRALAGITLQDAQVRVGKQLVQRGALLLTHHGVSGPAVLKLSAEGARVLHDKDYAFDLEVDWLPAQKPGAVLAELEARRGSMGKRLVLKAPLAGLPARLWEALVAECGFAPDLRWSSLSGEGARRLAAQVSACALPVSGKNLNKEEFVTCGGVRLREIDFKTMQSRLRPGLFFAGEILDIDAYTGGFNFQAAWTTGWIAGAALAAA